MQAKEVEVRKRIPPLHVVILILFTWAAFVWGYVTRVGSGTKYWVITGAWLPWQYLLLIAALLGKRGKVIDKTLLVAMMFALGIVAAKWYFFCGTSEVNFISNLAGSVSAALSIGVWPPAASQFVRDLIPSWMVVWDTAAAVRYYRGGGDPIWGPMVAPIVTWSLIFITLALQGMVLTWALLGPEFWEVERLPFPITIPSRFVVNGVYTKDPSLFGDLFFNARKYRIFWISAIVGFLINLPYVISQILPVPWGVFGPYGMIAIEMWVPNIVGIVQSVFPNAVWIVCRVGLVNILVFMLAPFEVATTVLVWIIGLGWIYPAIATWLGLIPAGAGPWWRGPIPLATLNPTSANLGLGLIVLFLLRRRIREFISSVRVGGEVNGIPARVLLALLLLGILVFLGIWSAAGLDPFTNFLVWLLFTLTSIGGAYYYAQLLWYGAHCSGYTLWRPVYSVSSAMGLLPAAPTPGHRNAAVFGWYVATMGTCVGPFESNSMYNPSILVSTYSLGAGTESDMRRLFYYVLIVLVFLAPFALSFDAWFNSHVGISNTSQGGMDMHSWNPASAAVNLGVRSITWSAPGIPLGHCAAWQLGWAIFILLCHFITARFPMLGYFLNPVGVATAGIATLWAGWINPIIGLIAKYLLVRIYGAKRAYDVIVEVVSGLAFGFGLLYLVLGAYVFFAMSIPTIAAFWR